MTTLVLVVVVKNRFHLSLIKKQLWHAFFIIKHKYWTQRIFVCIDIVLTRDSYWRH